MADLAAIEDFATLLEILLAQPDADSAIHQMQRVAGLIVCHARAIQGRNPLGNFAAFSRLITVSQGHG